AVDAVQKRIDEDVAVRDAELGKETLHTTTGFADEDAAHDGLVLRRILADHEHACRAVEPAAVEDRPPLDPKLVRRVDVSLGILGAQSQKRLCDIAWIKRMRHARAPLADQWTHHVYRLQVGAAGGNSVVYPFDTCTIGTRSRQGSASSS